jgi:hypothetical protein
MFVMSISLTCLGLWASTDCAITFLASLSMGTSSQFSSNDTFSVSLLFKAFTFQSLPGDSTEGDSLFSL